MNNFGFLLHEAANGIEGAEDESLKVIYSELKEISRRLRFNLKAGDTLNTTSLIHEAFLKLLKNENLSVADKNHFLAISSKAMRQIIINHIRRKVNYQNKVDEIQDGFKMGIDNSLSDKIEALERAMGRLEKDHYEMIRLIELRFYAGLSISDTASIMEISPATVKRKWQFCKSWLSKEISKV